MPEAAGSLAARSWMRVLASDDGVAQGAVAAAADQVDLGERLGAHGGGHLSRGGAAHAVGDHEQVAPDQVGVLVVAAHVPGLGEAGLVDDAQRGHVGAS